LNAKEAADVLAVKIKLHIGDSSVLFIHLPAIADCAAMKALIKIGTPAIPAVIKNLAESNDAEVRKLSLEVLCRIEGDNDIVQLRLQKALAAEKDLQRQARLQAALKALAELH
jgi:HEAT repeat protein